MAIRIAIFLLKYTRTTLMGTSVENEYETDMYNEVHVVMQKHQFGL